MENRAICLFSGGLDSVLCIKLLQDQGIECIPVNFTTPFFSADKKSGDINGTGLDIITIDITKDFIDVLRAPKHGYGKTINPCIDCKIMIMSKAKELMSKYNASFIASGEVLGQRPMSQQRDTMNTIARLAGVSDILVRPLSAKLLAETNPEKTGLLDREKFFDISGRSRKVQMELATHYGITEYSQPAGGCILTEIQFLPRIKDYLDNNDGYDKNTVTLLRYGRHFRVNDTKVVIGRDEHENNLISSLKQDGDLILSPKDVMGPIALVNGNVIDYDINIVAEILLSYSDCDVDSAIVTCEYFDGTIVNFPAECKPRETFRKYCLCV